MWKVLVLKVCRLGLMMPLWAVLGTVSAQDSIGVTKESAYASLVSAPKHGPVLDAVLAAWIDAEGFDAIRAHLQTRTEREDLTASEHAALGLLWRRLYEPVAAVAQWEKATASEPNNAEKVSRYNIVDAPCSGGNEAGGECGRVRFSIKFGRALGLGVS